MGLTHIRAVIGIRMAKAPIDIAGLIEGELFQNSDYTSQTRQLNEAFSHNEAIYAESVGGKLAGDPAARKRIIEELGQASEEVNALRRRRASDHLLMRAFQIAEKRGEPRESVIDQIKASLANNKDAAISPEVDALMKDFRSGLELESRYQPPMDFNNGEKTRVDLLTEAGTKIGSGFSFRLGDKVHSVVDFENQSQDPNNPLRKYFITHDATLDSTMNGLEEARKGAQEKIASLEKAAEAAKTGVAGMGGPGILNELQNQKEALAAIEKKQADYASGSAGFSNWIADDLRRVIKDDKTLIQHVPHGTNWFTRTVADTTGGLVSADLQTLAGLQYLTGFEDAAKGSIDKSKEWDKWREEKGFGHTAYRNTMGGKIGRELLPETAQTMVDLAFGIGVSTVARKGVKAVGRKIAGDVAEEVAGSAAASGMTSVARRMAEQRAVKNVTEWAARHGSYLEPFVSAIPGGLEEASSVVESLKEADAKRASADELEAQAKKLEERASPSSIEGGWAADPGAQKMADAARQSAARLRDEASKVEQNAALAFYGKLATTLVTDAIGFERILRRGPGSETLNEMAAKGVARKELQKTGADVTEEAIGARAKEIMEETAERVHAFLGGIGFHEKAKDLLATGQTEGFMELFQSILSNGIDKMLLDQNVDLINSDSFQEYAVGTLIGMMFRGATANMDRGHQLLLANNILAGKQRAMKMQEVVAQDLDKKGGETGIQGFGMAAKAEEVVKQRDDGKWHINDKLDYSTEDAPLGRFGHMVFDKREDAAEFAKTRWQRAFESAVDNDLRHKMQSSDKAHEESFDKAREWSALTDEETASLKAFYSTFFDLRSSRSNVSKETLYAHFLLSQEGHGPLDSLDFGDYKGATVVRSKDAPKETKADDGPVVWVNTTNKTANVYDKRINGWRELQFEELHGAARGDYVAAAAALLEGPPSSWDAVPRGMRDEVQKQIEEFAAAAENKNEGKVLPQNEIARWLLKSAAKKIAIQRKISSKPDERLYSKTPSDWVQAAQSLTAEGPMTEEMGRLWEQIPAEERDAAREQMKQMASSRLADKAGMSQVEIAKEYAKSGELGSSSLALPKSKAARRVLQSLAARIAEARARQRPTIAQLDAKREAQETKKKQLEAARGRLKKEADLVPVEPAGEGPPTRRAELGDEHYIAPSRGANSALPEIDESGAVSAINLDRIEEQFDALRASGRAGGLTITSYADSLVRAARMMREGSREGEDDAAFRKRVWKEALEETRSVIEGGGEADEIAVPAEAFQNGRVALVDESGLPVRLATTALVVPMKFTEGGAAKPDSSFQKILDGERTGTTRQMYNQPAPGDIIFIPNPESSTRGIFALVEESYTLKEKLDRMEAGIKAREEGRVQRKEITPSDARETLRKVASDKKRPGSALQLQMFEELNKEEGYSSAEEFRKRVADRHDWMSKVHIKFKPVSADYAAIRMMLTGRAALNEIKSMIRLAAPSTTRGEDAPVGEAIEAMAAPVAKEAKKEAGNGAKIERDKPSWIDGIELVRALDDLLKSSEAKRSRVSYGAHISPIQTILELARSTGPGALDGFRVQRGTSLGMAIAALQKHLLGRAAIGGDAADADPSAAEESLKNLGYDIEKIRLSAHGFLTPRGQMIVPGKTRWGMDAASAIKSGNVAMFVYGSGARMARSVVTLPDGRKLEANEKGPAVVIALEPKSGRKTYYLNRDGEFKQLAMDDSGAQVQNWQQAPSTHVAKSRDHLSSAMMIWFVKANEAIRSTGNDKRPWGKNTLGSFVKWWVVPGNPESLSELGNIPREPWMTSVVAEITGAGHKEAVAAARIMRGLETLLARPKDKQMNWWNIPGASGLSIPEGERLAELSAGHRDAELEKAIAAAEKQDNISEPALGLGATPPEEGDFTPSMGRAMFRGIKEPNPSVDNFLESDLVNLVESGGEEEADDAGGIAAEDAPGMNAAMDQRRDAAIKTLLESAGLLETKAEGTDEDAATAALRAEIAAAEERLAAAGGEVGSSIKEMRAALYEPGNQSTMLSRAMRDSVLAQFDSSLAAYVSAIEKERDALREKTKGVKADHDIKALYKNVTDRLKKSPAQRQDGKWVIFDGADGDVEKVGGDMVFDERWEAQAKKAEILLEAMTAMERAALNPFRAMAAGGAAEASDVIEELIGSDKLNLASVEQCLGILSLGKSERIKELREATANLLGIFASTRNPTGEKSKKAEPGQLASLLDEALKSGGLEVKDEAAMTPTQARALELAKEIRRLRKKIRAVWTAVQMESMAEIATSDDMRSRVERELVGGLWYRDKVRPWKDREKQQRERLREQNEDDTIDGVMDLVTDGLVLLGIDRNRAFEMVSERLAENDHVQATLDGAARIAEMEKAGAPREQVESERMLMLASFLASGIKQNSTASQLSQALRVTRHNVFGALEEHLGTRKIVSGLMPDGWVAPQMEGEIGEEPMAREMDDGLDRSKFAPFVATRLDVVSRAREMGPIQETEDGEEGAFEPRVMSRSQNLPWDKKEGLSLSPKNEREWGKETKDYVKKLRGASKAIGAMPDDEDSWPAIIDDFGLGEMGDQSKDPEFLKKVARAAALKYGSGEPPARGSLPKGELSGRVASGPEASPTNAMAQRQRRKKNPLKNLPSLTGTRIPRSMGLGESNWTIHGMDLHEMMGMAGETLAEKKAFWRSVFDSGADGHRLWQKVFGDISEEPEATIWVTDSPDPANSHEQALVNLWIENHKPVKKTNPLGKLYSKGGYVERGSISWNKEALGLGVLPKISLTRGKATAMTFVHESIHWMRITKTDEGQDLMEASMSPEDYEALMNYASRNESVQPGKEGYGVEGGARRGWERIEENIAEAVEQYFAISSDRLRGEQFGEAAGAVAKIALFIKNAWNRIYRGRRNEIPGEIVAAFDRFFIGEETEAQKRSRYNQAQQGAAPSAGLNISDPEEVAKYAEDMYGLKSPSPTVRKAVASVPNSAEEMPSQMSGPIDPVNGTGTSPEDHRTVVVGVTKDGLLTEADDVKNEMPPESREMAPDLEEMSHGEAQDAVGIATPAPVEKLRSYQPIAAPANAPALKQKAIARAHASFNSETLAGRAARAMIRIGSKLSVIGFAPKSAYLAVMEAKNIRSLIEAQMARILDDLQRAIDSTVSGSPAQRSAIRTQQLRHLNDFLSSPSHQARAAALSAMDSRLQMPAVAARFAIDKLGQQGINMGIFYGQLAGVVSSRGGFYLHRTYTLPDALRKAGGLEKWLANNPARMTAWTSAVRNLHAVMQAGRNPAATPQQADERLVEIVRLITRESASGPTGGGGTPSPMRYRGIDDAELEAIKDVLGLETDPIRNFITTMNGITDMIFRHELESRLRDDGIKNGYVTRSDSRSKILSEPFIREARARDEVPVDTSIVKDPMEAMARGALWGYSTTPEIAHWFHRLRHYEFNLGMLTPADHGLARWLKKTLFTMSFINGLWKLGQTVYSPPVLVGNAYASYLTLMGSGRLYHGLGRAFEVFLGSQAGALSKTANQQQTAELDRLTRLGIGESGQLHSLLEHFHDSPEARTLMMSYIASTPVSGSHHELTAAGKRIAKHVKKFFVTSYAWGDLFFKIGHFYAERDDLAQAFPNLTSDQLDAMAAERTEDTMYSNEREPYFIRTWKRFVPLGNFMSFTWGITRTMVNGYILGVSDLINGMKRRRAGEKGAGHQIAMGSLRLLALTSVSVATRTAVSALNSALGWDDEKYRAAVGLLPEFDRDGVILFLGEFEPGKSVGYLNIARFLPYLYGSDGAAMLATTIPKIMHALSTENDALAEDLAMEHLSKTISHFMSPWLDATASWRLGNMLLPLAGGTVPWKPSDAYGNEIYRESDSVEMKLRSVFRATWQLFTPGIAKWAAKSGVIGDAAERVILGDARKTETYATAMALGYRVGEMDLQKYVKINIGKSLTAYEDARDRFIGELKDSGAKKNTNELMAAAARFQAAKKVSLLKTSMIIDDALVLGVPPFEIAAALRDATPMAGTLAKKTSKELQRAVILEKFSGPMVISRKTFYSISDAIKKADDDKRWDAIKELVAKGIIRIEPGR